MSTTVYDLNRFYPKTTEKILVDVNILIYLQSGNTKKYDKLWEFVREKEIKMFFTTLSISEFINYFTRTGYKQYCSKHGLTTEKFDFKKEYQKTQHFLDIYDDVIDTLESEILPKMEILDYSKSDFLGISKISEHMLDINDALYLKKAIEEDLVIVTHDSDFFNIPIPQTIKVYTYNI